MSRKFHYKKAQNGYVEVYINNVYIVTCKSFKEVYELHIALV